MLAVLGAGGVCCRAASGSSDRSSRWRATAVERVRRKRAAGGRKRSARRGNATASLPTASRSGRPNAAATESAGRPSEKRPSAVRGSSPTPIFFVRPPGLLCGIPAHPAVAPATVLFPGLPPCSRTGCEAREALARTVPSTARDSRNREKGPTAQAMKTCRYRSHVLRRPRPSA